MLQPPAHQAGALAVADSPEVAEEVAAVAAGSTPRYFINVVSHDHVARGVDGGFTQANHGKPHALRRMKRGDYIVFYSPKTAFQGGEPLQAFTALGRVDDDEPYQIEMTPEFHPWRRRVVFENSKETSIRPLIDELLFIEDKTHWGYKFRFGVIEITKTDFDRIKRAMS